MGVRGVRAGLLAAAIAVGLAACASNDDGSGAYAADDLAEAVRRAQAGIDCPTFVAAPRGRPLEAWSRISSPFGYRRHPITGRPDMHSGVDLVAPEGAPVFAAATGLVAFAGERGGYGRLVVVAHACGFETRYAHLSEVSVSEGDVVATGAALGAVGATGRVTGPHLHYEIRVDGRPVNPAAML